MDIKGVAVSGKMLSGKGTFLTVFRKLVGGSFVRNLAFADKLKLFSKYLLVKISRFGHTQAGITLASEEVAKLMQEQLFKNEADFGSIYENIYKLANEPHTLEYAKPGIRMPDIDGIETDGAVFPKKDFDFDDIDKLLWTDSGKPRKMLQEIGTECVRSINDMVWIDYAFSVVKKHPELFFILTDARFVNEHVYAKKQKFLDIRLEASEKIRLKRGLARDGQDYVAMLAHPSETSLDNESFTVVLRNEGSLEELEHEVWASKSMSDLISQLRLRRDLKSEKTSCGSEQSHH